MSSPVPAPAGWAEGPRRQAVAATAARGLRRFAAARGIPASREFLLDYDVIEAFCVAGLPGRASSDPGHVPVGAVPAREAGARRAGAAGDAVRGREGARAVLAGRARRAGRHRRCPARSGEAGLGAGPGGVRHRGGAAARRAGGAARQRRYPPRPPGDGPGRRAGRAGSAGHRGLCRAGGRAGRRAGDGHLFRPGPADRGYKNFVTNFARTLTADPAAPRLRLGRCRSSFICGHLAAGTPAGKLLAITGICRGRVAGPLRTPRPRSPRPRPLCGPGTGATRHADGRRRAGDPRAGQRPGRAGRGVCRRAHRPQRARPRSSRPRWPTAPAGPARCRCAPCSPRCCAWRWMTGRCS